MLETLRFEVEENLHKSRLDEFLYGKITALSKMYLAKLIQEGNCTVNGNLENRGFKVQKGDAVEITVNLDTVTSQLPENLPLDILFEDEELIVINKAVGMLVHPTKGVKSGTLLNALSYHLNIRNKTENNSSAFIRAGLIHRLDKKTSGLMVISKTPRAHSLLSNHFQRKLVEKKYYAVVGGIIEEDLGTIIASIGKNEDGKFWVITNEGKYAETNFQVKKRNTDSTLLELEPVTGRTNQLRLHCLHIGHPIIGDDTYGGRDFPRLCLHAYKLAFRHPKDNREMLFETDLPEDFMLV